MSQTIRFIVSNITWAQLRILARHLGMTHNQVIAHAISRLFYMFIPPLAEYDIVKELAELESKEKGGINEMKKIDGFDSRLFANDESRFEVIDPESTEGKVYNHIKNMNLPVDAMLSILRFSDLEEYPQFFIKSNRKSIIKWLKAQGGHSDLK